MTKPLTYDEAEVVAAFILPRWTGITGLSEVPKVEAIADLFQSMQRKAGEIVAAREGNGEAQ